MAYNGPNSGAFAREFLRVMVEAEAERLREQGEFIELMNRVKNGESFTPVSDGARTGKSAEKPTPPFYTDAG